MAKKAKKPSKHRPKFFWLTRNLKPLISDETANYRAFRREPKPSQLNKGIRTWIGDGTGTNVPVTICCHDWHRIADKDLHLKPGGGPIPVEVRRAKIPK